MIASVRGTVLAVSGPVAVIEVGGVGLAVQVTPQHALTLRVAHEASFHTALIVREDDLSLFGFASRAELEVFDLLRGVSGVGPKTAKLIAVSLQGKLLAPAITSGAAGRPAGGSITQNVVTALVGLGWNERAAAAAVDEAAAEATDDERETVAALLRLSLARLGPGVRS